VRGAGARGRTDNGRPGENRAGDEGKQRGPKSGPLLSSQLKWRRPRSRRQHRKPGQSRLLLGLGILGGPPRSAIRVSLMVRQLNQSSDVVDAIREIAGELGRAPSLSEFRARAGVSKYQILRHFLSWREALRASGFEPNPTNIRLEDDVLLKDWGDLVRKHRHIPTQNLYSKEGTYSPGLFDKHFGPWSAIPERFCSFAQSNPDWADVVALLPIAGAAEVRSIPRAASTDGRDLTMGAPASGYGHNKLDGVPTYGDPIDFRGLRHEPVNEQGVVFLFGMVARELGYLVEAVQTGYPDCEAKRQIGPGKWQRGRIEFEYESRNFRDHGHSADGCDLIVCWRHNWVECPQHLEVLELRSTIKTLASSDDL
jgi:hypothetical protein